ncbi:hypothetical protein [Flavobacterium undicola]|uniref:hypothetical protein n=1 Tax=Flavobacterium undicola TaxID=1932779 RepID=UPI001377224B|nr:hypothetical protein [Flavobacterium undicola]MBA0882609.1 hypothetical protein [Flavobacterium undicola]
MKKFLSLVFLVSLIVSCALVKDKNQLIGNVEAIEYGKDGYTAKIKTVKNEVYLATISRINLVDSKDYKVFKIGEKVALKGEFWKSDTEKYIKVTDIVTVN